MKLKKLFADFKNIKIRGDQGVTINGLTANSRTVSPGNLFLARRGRVHDGNAYINQALQAGAAAVVTDLYDPFLDCPQVICLNPEILEAKLAARFYQEPSKELFCVGITGSKGKTTTSYLCKHFLDGFGKPCGLMNSVEILTMKDRYDATHTTHDAITNQKFLKKMVDQGCKASVIEVSSHALDQSRVDEIAFDAAIFTNLYPDHLDYHASFEEYADAKKKLFNPALEVAILNVDDPLAKEFPHQKNRMEVGIKTPCDIQATNLEWCSNGAKFFVQGISFESPLLGEFNVYNVLTALGLGIHSGKSLEEMAYLLKSFPGVPGRCERVSNSSGVHVFVDFSHTGPALASVLSTLKAIAKKRLIVVFGAGGDRDRMRRREMAYAAQKYADLSIITSDNPRCEDPGEIANEIASFYEKKPQIIIDRMEAIKRALSSSEKDDIVVIAGKGHEKVQIFSSTTLYFDDVAVVKEILGS